MNSVWSEFNRSFVSFYKNVWSPPIDTEALAMAVGACSAKIADWAICLVGFYLTSVVAIAVVSLQVQTQLPAVFHVLYFVILLGFTSLLLAEFVKFKSAMTNQILRCLNLFFLVSAFFVAVSIPFPLYFKLISFIVFLAALYIIIWFATFPAA